MKSITRHQGIITDLQRLPSSANGNPRYSFVIDGYDVATSSDSSYGYSITNYEGKEVIAEIGTHYGRTTLNAIRSV